MASRLFCSCGHYVEVDTRNGWLIPHNCNRKPVPPIGSGEQMIIDSAQQLADQGEMIFPHALLVIIERLAGIRDEHYNVIAGMAEKVSR